LKASIQTIKDEQINDKAVESLDSININDIRFKNINFVASNPLRRIGQNPFNYVESGHDFRRFDFTFVVITHSFWSQNSQIIIVLIAKQLSFKLYQIIIFN
jgi:hypothetical protein